MMMQNDHWYSFHHQSSIEDAKQDFIYLIKTSGVVTSYSALLTCWRDFHFLQFWHVEFITIYVFVCANDGNVFLQHIW